MCEHFALVYNSDLAPQAAHNLNPVQIMKREAEEEKSETARLSSFIGAITIGDLVKTTMGPRGMDKILISVGRENGK